MYEVIILLICPEDINLPTPKSSNPAVREIAVRLLISGLFIKASIKFSATPQTPNPPKKIDYPDLIPFIASFAPGTYLLNAFTMSCFYLERTLEKLDFVKLLSIFFSF